MKNRIVASLLCVVITGAMIVSSTSKLEAQNDMVQVNVQGAVQTQGLTEQEQEEAVAKAKAEAELQAQAEAEAKAEQAKAEQVKATQEEASQGEVAQGDAAQAQPTQEDAVQGDVGAAGQEDSEGAQQDSVTGTENAESNGDQETGQEIDQDGGEKTNQDMDQDGDQSQDTDKDDKDGLGDDVIDTDPSDEVVPDDGIPENMTGEVKEPEKNLAEKPEEGSKTAEHSVTGSFTGYSGLNFLSAGFLTNSALGSQVTQLKENYHISFASNFAEIMEQIENEYRTENDLDDSLTAANWQEIIAVYVMEQNRRGVTEVTLNENSKVELAKIFGEMNLPMMVGNEVHYEGQNAATYLKNHQEEISDASKKAVEDYTSEDCTLLCAAATSADPLVLQTLTNMADAGQSEVVKKSYELVGKVSYFWGGKSSSLGWDNRWGASTAVTASGSKSSGSIRAYGLDCSGYVAWVFANAYGNSAAISYVGQSTAEQWALSEPIAESEARPGDLVFLKTPDSAGINHVGILVGQESDGTWLVSHCSSSKGGVTVTSANSVGFRYVRRPMIYSAGN